MTAEDERQFARAVIGRVLEAHARTELLVGRTPPSAEEEFALADGIHAALFGVGRLQPLLDDPDVACRRRMQVTIPLGDTEMLDRLRERGVLITFRAAGSTCLVEADLSGC